MTLSDHAQPYKLPSCRRHLGMAWKLADAGLPSLIFVVSYRVFGSALAVAAGAALGAAAVLLAVRLARRQPIRLALIGPLGVAVAVMVAWTTGRPQDYFAPGILWGAAVGAAAVASMIVRLPLVGVVIGVTSSGRRWRDRFTDPIVLRADMWASGIWAAVLAGRFAAEVHFYLSGGLEWLAVLKFAGGCPLFGAILALTYVIERRARRGP